MSDAEKLLSCPFCGGEAEIYSGKQEFLTHEEMCYSVFCQKCHCTTQYEPEEQMAIQDWNKRA